MLFYAVGGAPYHSHVTASVHAGTVQVSVAIGEEDIQVEAGIGIDDYRYGSKVMTSINYQLFSYFLHRN